MESSNLSFDSSHAFGRVTTSGSYGFFNCNCNTLGFNPWSPFVICPCGMKVHPQCVSLVASIPCTRKQVQRVTTMHRTAVQAFLSACFTELPEWVYISKYLPNYAKTAIILRWFDWVLKWGEMHAIFECTTVTSLLAFVPSGTDLSTLKTELTKDTLESVVVEFLNHYVALFETAPLVSTVVLWAYFPDTDNMAWLSLYLTLQRSQHNSSSRGFWMATSNLEKAIHLQQLGWDFIPTPVNLPMTRAKQFPPFYRLVMEERYIVCHIQDQQHDFYPSLVQFLLRSSAGDPKWTSLVESAKIRPEQKEAFRRNFFEHYLTWLFKYSGEFIICHDLSKNIRGAIGFSKNFIGLSIASIIDRSKFSSTDTALVNYLTLLYDVVLISTSSLGSTIVHFLETDTMEERIFDVYALLFKCLKERIPNSIWCYLTDACQYSLLTAPKATNYFKDILTPLQSQKSVVIGGVKHCIFLEPGPNTFNAKLLDSTQSCMPFLFFARCADEVDPISDQLRQCRPLSMQNAIIALQDSDNKFATMQVFVLEAKNQSDSYEFLMDAFDLVVSKIFKETDSGKQYLYSFILELFDGYHPNEKSIVSYHSDLNEYRSGLVAFNSLCDFDLTSEEQSLRIKIVRNNGKGRELLLGQKTWSIDYLLNDYKFDLGDEWFALYNADGVYVDAEVKILFRLNRLKPANPVQPENAKVIPSRTATHELSLPSIDGDRPMRIGTKRAVPERSDVNTKTTNNTNRADLNDTRNDENEETTAILARGKSSLKLHDEKTKEKLQMMWALNDALVSRREKVNGEGDNDAPDTWDED